MLSLMENKSRWNRSWTCTWEPGPVLGNLDLNKTLVGDLYSGTWTCTREPGPVLGNLDLYSFMHSGCFFVYIFCLFEYINEYRLRSWPNIDGTYGTKDNNIRQTSLWNQYLIGNWFMTKHQRIRYLKVRKCRTNLLIIQHCTINYLVRPAGWWKEF